MYCHAKDHEMNKLHNILTPQSLSDLQIRLKSDNENQMTTIFSEISKFWVRELEVQWRRNVSVSRTQKAPEAPMSRRGKWTQQRGRCGRLERLLWTGNFTQPLRRSCGSPARRRDGSWRVTAGPGQTLRSSLSAHELRFKIIGRTEPGFICILMIYPSFTSSNS